MTSKQRKNRNNLLTWLPVILFIVLAIAFRLYRTSSENYYLLAGGDGPYLPLQVKSLFIHDRLAFADMPLLFTLCTIFAKILFFLHTGTANHCILLSVKIIDAFLPPLSAIPVFLLVKELSVEHIKSAFANYLMVAFAILSFTPLIIFSYQLQKNGLAMVWIFSFLYYSIKLIKYENRNNFVKALVVMILCALTHFGSFGLLIFLSFLMLAFWVTAYNSSLSISLLKRILLIFIILTAAISLIAFFDYMRFLRLVHFPFRIFEAPVVLYALNGQNLILKGYTLLNVITMNCLALQGIILLLHNRAFIEKYKFIAGLSYATGALFLSDPFIGLEWANRLFMLAYVPITMLYTILCSSVSFRWTKIPTLSVFILLIVFSMANAILNKPVISISKEAFIEFQQLKNLGLFTPNDAIVSRQDLRLLSNWILNTKGVSDYLLTKKEFSKYNAIYIIKQIKGKSLSLRDTEKQLPGSNTKVFQGAYFEVYKMNESSCLPTEPWRSFKGVKGTVVEILGGKIVVKDFKSNLLKTVYTNRLRQDLQSLSKGMKVEINGEWKSFSLAIYADTIKKVKNFE